MQIRPLNLNDLSALQAISCQTFFDTFAQYNRAEDMQVYLSEHFSCEQLSKELANLNMHFYFIEQKGEPIGYLKLNTHSAQTEFRRSNTMEIERIYVQKAWHGKGIGKMLLKFALQQAISQNIHSLWLGVWEHNHQALSFYRKNGFVPFDAHIFHLGNDPQRDILMKLVLSQSE